VVGAGDAVIVEELRGREVLEEVATSPDNGQSDLFTVKLGGPIQILTA
jgi:hypothetical protein